MQHHVRELRRRGDPEHLVEAAELGFADPANAKIRAPSWEAACEALYPLLTGGRQRDIPTLDLASRTLEAMKRPRSFDPVFELPGK